MKLCFFLLGSLAKAQINFSKYHDDYEIKKSATFSSVIFGRGIGKNNQFLNKVKTSWSFQDWSINYIFAMHAANEGLSVSMNIFKIPNAFKT